LQNIQLKIRKYIISILTLLIIGLFFPIFIIIFGNYISPQNKENYFQYSSIIVAFCSFFAQQYQSKIKSILYPNSDFEPPECFNLRQKYHKLVITLESVWKILALITIVLGGLGIHIAKFLISQGHY